MGEVEGLMKRCGGGCVGWWLCGGVVEDRMEEGEGEEEVGW